MSRECAYHPGRVAAVSDGRNWPLCGVCAEARGIEYKLKAGLYYSPYCDHDVAGGCLGCEIDEHVCTECDAGLGWSSDGGGWAVIGVDADGVTRCEDCHGGAATPRAF